MSVDYSLKLFVSVCVLGERGERRGESMDNGMRRRMGNEKVSKMEDT